jgi:aminotransferase EvaB
MIPISDPVRQLRDVPGGIEPVLHQVVASGQWLNGPWTERMSRGFAEWCGAAHCIPVGNATDALELIFRSLGVGPGDEIVTVANAGGYTTTACRIVGACPVWIDVTRSTLGLNLAAVGEALSERTKVVVATHLYGIMVDVDALRTELARLGAAHVRIVEDCAQAHGAILRGHKAGALGDAAAFSFYPIKNLGALGDAGAVVTNDPEIAERVLRLHQYGWRERFHSEVPMGRNSRIDEIQAAIIMTKLPHLERWNAERRRILARYIGTLKPPVRVVGACTEANVAHLAVVRVPSRDRFRASLAAKGIGTAVHYPVLDYEQVSQKSLPGRRMRLPESERAVGEIVTLPCFPGLTASECDKIIDAANAAAAEIG